MPGVPRHIREQWPAFLALLGVMFLYVQVADVRVAVKGANLRHDQLESRVNAVQSGSARARRENPGGNGNGDSGASARNAVAPTELARAASGSNNKNSGGGGSSASAPRGGMAASAGRKSQPSAGSSPNDGGKPAYEWPQPLPEWELVDEDQANVAPLVGEGTLEESLASIEREGDGVLFNAIHRDATQQRASKPIVEAMKGAQRMREASKEAGGESKLKYCLVTERGPFEFMLNEQLCKPMWPECIGFAESIKVFDTILFYDDFSIPAIIERRERFQTWPELWLKRIMASLNSPFKRTLVVDSDVYGCAVFEKLFDDFLSDSDVAITLAPAPFGASRNYAGAFRSGFPKSYAEYTERNLGLHMLATGKLRVQRLLALFRDVYIRQANDTEHTSIGNDQCAFREAMWTMKHKEGLTEVTIPAEIGCRHDAGCADGCYVVHRHNNQEMSRAELQALAKQKAADKKAAKLAGANAAKASADELEVGPSDDTPPEAEE